MTSDANRVVTPAADGSIVFRPGRSYRVLVIVEGETDTGNLRGRLYDIGFARGSVGVSLPADWQKARPRDWPNEGIYALMDGQSLIRVSGVFGGRAPVRVASEVEIEPGAIMRLLEAWDHAASAPEVSAGAAPALARTSPSSSDDKGRKVLIGAAAIAAVAVGWNWLSGKKKLEREQERFESLAAKAEREEITRRVHELTSGGMNRYDALATAEGEAEGKTREDDEPRIIVVRA